MRMVRISSPPRTCDLKTILRPYSAVNHTPRGGLDLWPTHPRGWRCKLPSGVFCGDAAAAMLWSIKCRTEFVGLPRRVAVNRRCRRPTGGSDMKHILLVDNDDTSCA